MNRQKLSYYHRLGEQQLISLTLGQCLRNAALKWPTRKAVISYQQNKYITYNELNSEATRLAAGLIKLKLQQGDRVGLWAPNCIEWVIVQYAIAKAGLVLVNINPGYETDELRHCINLSKISALIMIESHQGRIFHDLLSKAVPDLIYIGKGSVKSNELNTLKNVIIIGSPDKRERLSLDELKDLDLIQAENMIQIVEEKVEIHDLYNVQFTSGSTGRPKATLLTHHKLVNGAYISGKYLGFTDNKTQHVVCLPNPLFHMIGYSLGILSSTLYGCTSVLPSSVYSPSTNIKVFLEEKCTTIFGTTTMIIDLLNKARELNLSATDLGLEQIFTGGAVFPENLYKYLKYEFGVKHICIAYGMTECGSGTFYTIREDNIENQATTVGRLAEHLEAKVVDLQGRMVEFGQPGELWIRGYGTMLGYFDDPKATAETITTDGWVKTGDIFILNENGYGKIVGRVKDIIIRGGENILPREIEDVLLSYPGILEAHVYGIPDERLGEIVCATVRAREDHEITSELIKSFCKGKIAYYKIPVHIDVVKEFINNNGKIMKSNLRKIMINKLHEICTK